MACCGEVNTKAQNDVADFIKTLIALLQRLAGFFDSLNAPAAQALGACEQAFVDELKAELFQILGRLPTKVQGYFNCKLGLVDPVSTQSIAGLGSLIALLPKLMELVKYLPQLLALWKQLQDSGLLGNLPGGPTQPVMPASDYSPKSVQRC